MRFRGIYCYNDKPEGCRTQKIVSIHTKTFRSERDNSEQIMIPDRRLSSKKISVEGVLWSSEGTGDGKKKTMKHTLTCFEVLIENMACLGIFAVFPNDDARTTYNLASIAIAINLAKACPFTQDLRVPDLDKGNGVRGAKRFYELYILRLRTGLNKHTKVGLAPIQGLCALAQAASKTIVFERLLQNLLIVTRNLRGILIKSGTVHLKCLLNRQLSFGCF